MTFSRWVHLILLGLLVSGCRTVPPLPPANLKEPGWTIHEGQAVWTRRRGTPEIAGEILVAQRDGRAFVQFSKPPFPIVTAQNNSNSWEIEVSLQNLRYSGRGRPPERLIWLQIPPLLADQPLPRGWSWERTDIGWKLSNPKTGEILEGYFAQ
jgi:hypothetical protein